MAIRNLITLLYSIFSLTVQRASQDISVTHGIADTIAADHSLHTFTLSFFIVIRSIPDINSIHCS